MKSVFIIAIVAVAMIGVMVPSGFAQYDDNVKISKSGIAKYGIFSVENIAITDREYYKLAKIFVNVKVQNLELEDRYILVSPTSFTLQNENGKSYFNQERDCKSPARLFYEITGKTGSQVTIPLCFHVENHYEFFEVYYRSDKNYHIDSIQLIESSKSTTDTLSNLSEKLIDESTKLISESSKVSEMLIEQEQKIFEDNSDKKLVCPSNSYFGMDDNEKVVCRDLKTNEIVPSVSTNSLTDNSSEEGGGCLIATATYGSELAPQVQQLRELRDNQLMNTESGAAFMGTFNDVYYSFSPIIADYERENPYFKEAVKLAITPMISSLSLMENAETESEVLGLGLSVITLNIGMYLGIPTIIIFGIKKRN
ncbi:MAG: hypothetical protein HPQ69_00010 [Marine Group I thaumarchaeote]|nr:MAG: hypothetical protein HPQ69_00010 [Marine Group I thaumarchaeote]